ncbi:unnamed protein product [Amoebophrya sp. A120]|nr:unnamed protein product [Amoebophrya sp. A120]|eukprot:GSA120T00018295001.1
MTTDQVPDLEGDLLPAGSPTPGEDLLQDDDMDGLDDDDAENTEQVEDSNSGDETEQLPASQRLSRPKIWMLDLQPGFSSARIGCYDEAFLMNENLDKGGDDVASTTDLLAAGVVPDPVASLTRPDGVLSYTGSLGFAVHKAALQHLVDEVMEDEDADVETGPAPMDIDGEDEAPGAAASSSALAGVGAFKRNTSRQSADRTSPIGGSSLHRKSPHDERAIFAIEPVVTAYCGPFREQVAQALLERASFVSLNKRATLAVYAHGRDAGIFIDYVREEEFLQISLVENGMVLASYDCSMNSTEQGENAPTTTKNTATGAAGGATKGNKGKGLADRSGSKLHIYNALSRRRVVKEVDFTHIGMLANFVDAALNANKEPEETNMKPAGAVKKRQMIHQAGVVAGQQAATSSSSRSIGQQQQPAVDVEQARGQENDQDQEFARGEKDDDDEDANEDSSSTHRGFSRLPDTQRLPVLVLAIVLQLLSRVSPKNRKNPIPIICETKEVQSVLQYLQNFGITLKHLRDLYGDYNQGKNYDTSAAAQATLTLQPGARLAPQGTAGSQVAQQQHRLLPPTGSPPSNKGPQQALPPESPLILGNKTIPQTIPHATALHQPPLAMKGQGKKKGKKNPPAETDATCYQIPNVHNLFCTKGASWYGAMLLIALYEKDLERADQFRTTYLEAKAGFEQYVGTTASNAPPVDLDLLRSYLKKAAPGHMWVSREEFEADRNVIYEKCP